MKIAKLILCLVWLSPGWLTAQDAKVTPLMSKDLGDIHGQEGLMITVALVLNGTCIGLSRRA